MFSIFDSSLCFFSLFLPICFTTIIIFSLFVNVYFSIFTLFRLHPNPVNVNTPPKVLTITSTTTAEMYWSWSLPLSSSSIIQPPTLITGSLQCTTHLIPHCQQGLHCPLQHPILCIGACFDILQQHNDSSPLLPTPFYNTMGTALMTFNCYALINISTFWVIWHLI